MPTTRFSIPAVGTVTTLLVKLAPEFGYDAADSATFITRFPSPSLAYLSGERLLVLYDRKGLDAVCTELARLRKMGVI